MPLPWTADAVQHLIAHPRRLLETEPWQSWIRDRGGLAQLYTALLAFPLAEREHQVLTMMLHQPGLTNRQYADQLYLHRVSFQRILRRLLDALAIYLTTHEPVPTAPSHPFTPGRWTFPAPLTPLIGRTALLGTITGALLDPGQRLITLIGPGGIGKTRLALQATQDVQAAFADGGTFIDLTSLREPSQVLPSMLESLAIPAHEEVAEARLIAWLAPKYFCLVIDNAEHLLDAMPMLNRVLRQARYVKILVTSRVPLDVYGEHLIRVPPLEVPALDAALPQSALQTNAALQLFAARAHAADHSFALTDSTIPLAHSICLRLEGIPLALELAAAQLREQCLEHLAAGVEQRLPMLVNGPRDVDHRQRTMRATIAWSYELLNPGAQALFRQLGVLLNGWTSALMHAICLPTITHQEAEDLLQTLLRHQLIYEMVDTPDDPRYGMLETIREYAADQLIAHGEERAVRLRHLAVYADAAQPIEPGLLGPDQVAWFQRIRTDYPNYRAALAWSSDAGHGDLGMQLVARLWRYWTWTPDPQAEAWVRTLTDHARPTVNPRFLASALQGRGVLLLGSNLQEALRIFGMALEASERAGDQWRSASLHNVRGTCWLGLGAHTEARAAYTEGLRLRRALGDRGEISGSLFNFGLLAYTTSQYAEAWGYYGEARTLFEELGDTGGMAMLLNNMGALALAEGRYALAIDYLTAAMPLREQGGGEAGIVMTQLYLAKAYLGQGNIRHARTLLLQTIERFPTLEGWDEVEIAVTVFVAMQLTEQRLTGVLEIYGAIRHVRAQQGIQSDSVMAADHAKIHAAAVAALGAEQVAAAMERGHAMTREALITGMTRLLSARPVRKRQGGQSVPSPAE